MDRMSCIFGNQIPDKVCRKATRTKAGYVRRFGDDSNVAYTLETRPLPVIGERLGVRDICLATGERTAPRRLQRCSTSRPTRPPNRYRHIRRTPAWMPRVRPW